MNRKLGNTEKPGLKAGNKQRPALLLLDYKESPTLDTVALDKAFDKLFAEVLKDREKVINKVNGHL